MTDNISINKPINSLNTNQPLDIRTLVNSYSDIQYIPNPYIGMTITVKVDETNNNKMTDYKVKSLKSNTLGMNNTVIDEIERLDVYVGMNNLEDTIEELSSQLDNNTNQLYDISLNVKKFMLDEDGKDISLAVQRAIDSIGNAVTNSHRILLPYGEYEWSTPVLIDKKDGITIEGCGRWATKLKSVGELKFNDTLNLPNDYNTNAFFIVTKRRVTGGVDGELNPQGANSHAWFINFKGFSMHNPDKSKLINGIFTHGMAHCMLEDLYGEWLKYGVDFGDSGVYRVTTLNCDWCNCVNGYKNVKGTSFNALSCGYQRTDEGWEINSHYSTLTCCAIDHWGKGKYAYDLEGIGITLNGCGLEKGYGGVLNVHGRTAVVFNGCNLAGGAIPNQENYNGQDSIDDFGVSEFSVISDSAKALFNNTTIRQEYSTDGTTSSLKHFPFKIKSGSVVQCNLDGEIYGARARDIFICEEGGELIITGADNDFGSSFNIANDVLTTDDTYYRFPCTNANYGITNANTNKDGFKSKSYGVYKIDVNLILTGTSINYILLQTSKGTSLFLEEGISTLNGKTRLNYNGVMKLSANEELYLILRTNTGGNITILKNSKFIIHRIA